jgi:hypothetical protein
VIFKDARDLLDAELISLDMEKAAAEQIRRPRWISQQSEPKSPRNIKYRFIPAKRTCWVRRFRIGQLLGRLRIIQAGINTAAGSRFRRGSANAVVARKVGVYVPRMWKISVL